MINTIPNYLTLFRIAMVPLITVAYLLGVSGLWVALIFLLTSVTDYLDGLLARRLNQVSRLGAFLDPVADKLMVVVVLVLLLSDREVLEYAISSKLFTIVSAIIIGREIAISGLREWMAEIGSRTQVAVSGLGKFKTSAQMAAITLLLYKEDFGAIPVFRIGEFMLYIAAGLTLWSMVTYLRAAWPELEK
jgi:CDP-diacylglycerol--glycerol-3-phosphate 3-phosphatidyltransferase